MTIGFEILSISSHKNDEQFIREFNHKIELLRKTFLINHISLKINAHSSIKCLITDEETIP